MAVDLDVKAVNDFAFQLLESLLPFGHGIKLNIYHAGFVDAVLVAVEGRPVDEELIKVRMIIFRCGRCELKVYTHAVFGRAREEFSWSLSDLSGAERAREWLDGALKV